MSDYTQRLDMIWDRRLGKLDWLGMEFMLVEILKDTNLTDEQKVKLTKECIDAYTKRGHFPELWKDGKRL